MLACHQLTSHAGISRPIGQKKAKAIALAEKLDPASQSMEIAASLQALAQAQMKSNEVQASISLEKTRRYDDKALAETVDRYIKLKMHDEAIKAMQKLEEFRAQHQAKKGEEEATVAVAASASASMPKAEDASGISNFSAQAASKIKSTSVSAPIPRADAASDSSISSASYHAAAATGRPINLLLDKFNTEDELDSDD